MGKYDFDLDINLNDSNMMILNLIKEKSVVLEFGPYKGRMTKYLKEELDCKVYAVEIDPEAVVECSNYTVNTVNDNIENYTWMGKFNGIVFDYVLFVDVLEHLVNPSEVLRNAKKFLKFDGSICISVPNIAHNSILLNLVNNKFNYTPTGLLDNGHVHFFGYDNLIELIFEIGMIPVIQKATYAAVGKNEVTSKYSDVSYLLQQELRKRKYGDVYQYIFEIKNNDFVNNEKIPLQKYIQSMDYLGEKITINYVSKKNHIGDHYIVFDCTHMENQVLNISEEDEIDEILISFDKMEGFFEIHAIKRLNDLFVDLSIVGETALDSSKRLHFIKDGCTIQVLLEKYVGKIELKIQKIQMDEKQFISLIESNENYKISLNSLHNEMINNNNRIEQLENEIKVQIGKLNEKEKNIKLTEEYIVSLQCQISNYKDEKAIFESEKTDCKQTLHIYESEKAKLELLIQDKNDNINFLTEQLNKNERSLSKIMDSKSWKVLMKYWNLKHKFNRITFYLSHPYALKQRLFHSKVPQNIIKDHQEDELITVVIPIYDREQELIESINSILNQTYQNFELILVCDGSPENTLKIVDSYKENDKVRIYKFLNNSGNAVRGRNKAIREARGRYLAFQDSDDIAEKDRLELSISYMNEYHVDVVYGGWRAKLEGRTDVDLENGQEVFSPDCDYTFLKEICVPCQSTVMVKLEALRDVGGLKDVMRYREDHELWLRLAYFGYQFKSIQKILTNLRLHEANLELSLKTNDEYWKQLMLQEHKTKAKVKPKIGYIIAGCDISGGLSVICKHANILLQKGYDVQLICTTKDKYINWYPDQKVEIISLCSIEDNYDLLIATFWTTAYTLEKLPAKRKLYFVQSDERNFYESSSKDWVMVQKTYEMDYEFITMAKWAKDWLFKEFNIKSTIIPNGIDFNIVYQSSPIIPKTNKLRILIEGPISVPFKGVAKSFQILSDLDCEVWCVSSEGRLDPHWKCDMFFEKVPFHKMKDIYSSCDILLKMSEVESFCLPALEMMACGGIAIVARVNGVDEYLENNTNGFITEQGDLQAPRELVIKLMQNPEILTYMKMKALETSKLWSWDYSTEILVNNVIGNI